MITFAGMRNLGNSTANQAEFQLHPKDAILSAATDLSVWGIQHPGVLGTTAQWTGYVVGGIADGLLPDTPGQAAFSLATAALGGPLLRMGLGALGEAIPVLSKTLPELADDIGNWASNAFESAKPTIADAIDQQLASIGAIKYAVPPSAGRLLAPPSVQALDVGAYAELQSRAVAGDLLEHDHIPSFAALRTAAELDAGGPLTKAQLSDLYSNGTAVEVPRDVHINGPTFGGRNTPSQIQADALDLRGAVDRDTTALRYNMLSSGYNPVDIDRAIQSIYERNIALGVIK